MTSFQDESGFQKYEDFPLVHSMLQYETSRTASLKEQGKPQMTYPQSSDGWIPTIFIIEGRALDWMIFPWLLVVGHATAYTFLQEIFFPDHSRDNDSWEIFFSFALHSTLAFLLVFRVNRAAGRFWVARRHWGDIVAHMRSLVNGIIVHGDYDRFNRDEAIRWIAAYTIATMDFIRGQKDIAFENYGGILSTQEIKTLVSQKHPPTYASDEARTSLKRLFYVDANTPVSLAIARTQEMDTLENQLNTMIWCCGGMELIKTTPLPMVYVSHLRTFLILNLILLPWVFGPSWGWATIPIVAVSAFAWLGIESAAFEVERPFFSNRVNSLNMDGYILSLLSTIQQQIRNHADREIQRKSSEASKPGFGNLSNNQNAVESDAEEC